MQQLSSTESSSSNDDTSDSEIGPVKMENKKIQCDLGKDMESRKKTNRFAGYYIYYASNLEFYCSVEEYKIKSLVQKNAMYEM